MSGRRIRVYLTHTPDARANYYGDEALAALREAAEVRLNDTGRNLSGRELAEAAAGFGDGFLGWFGSDRLGKERDADYEGAPLPRLALHPYAPLVRLHRPAHYRQPQPDAAELAELVLEEAGVAVVPGEAFGTPGYFRLSYALGDADLEKGVTRMAELLGEAQ